MVNPNGEFLGAIGNDYLHPANGYQRIGLADPADPRVSSDHELRMLSLANPVYLELATLWNSILELTRDTQGSYRFRNMTYAVEPLIVSAEQAHNVTIIGRESTPALIPAYDRKVSRWHLGFTVLSNPEVIVLQQMGSRTGTVVYTRESIATPQLKT